MSPSVGAPGCLRQNLFAGHSSNSRGECALDCSGIRLHLPSGEFGAVVGQNKFEVARHINSLQVFANLMQSGERKPDPECCVSYTIAFHVAVCDETQRSCPKNI